MSISFQIALKVETFSGLTETVFPAAFLLRFVELWPRSNEL
jgi:hypothetical protein